MTTTASTSRKLGVACGCAFVALLACAKKEAPAEREAPASSVAPAVSAALAAPVSASAKAIPLVVDGPTSSVKFLMDSPLEKIDGDVSGSASGELAIDLEDLSKSRGIVRIDLDKLVLYQQKRADEAGDFGDRKKSEKQNEHARSWFQLDAREGEVTPEQSAQNRTAEFRIDEVAPAAPNVLAMSGSERKVLATVSGVLRVHGRQVKKSAKVELTFTFAGDKLASARVKTTEPFPVNLDEFEIHPRDAAGKFVRTVTDAIGSNLKGKLAKEAPVMLDLTAKAK